MATDTLSYPNRRPENDTHSISSVVAKAYRPAGGDGCRHPLFAVVIENYESFLPQVGGSAPQSDSPLPFLLRSPSGPTSPLLEEVKPARQLGGQFDHFASEGKSVASGVILVAERPVVLPGHSAVPEVSPQRLSRLDIPVLAEHEVPIARRPEYGQTLCWIPAVAPAGWRCWEKCAFGHLPLFLEGEQFAPALHPFRSGLSGIHDSIVCGSSDEKELVVDILVEALALEHGQSASDRTAEREHIPVEEGDPRMVCVAVQPAHIALVPYIIPLCSEHLFYALPSPSVVGDRSAFSGYHVPASGSSSDIRWNPALNCRWTQDPEVR